MQTVAPPKSRDQESKNARSTTNPTNAYAVALPGRFLAPSLNEGRSAQEAVALRSRCAIKAGHVEVGRAEYHRRMRSARGPGTERCLGASWMATHAFRTPACEAAGQTRN